jgi:hypothetical protein
VLRVRLFELLDGDDVFKTTPVITAVLAGVVVTRRALHPSQRHLQRENVVVDVRPFDELRLGKRLPEPQGLLDTEQVSGTQHVLMALLGESDAVPIAHGHHHQASPVVTSGRRTERGKVSAVQTPSNGLSSPPGLLVLDLVEPRGQVIGASAETACRVKYTLRELAPVWQL